MARNVEIKAAVIDVVRVTAALATLSPEPGVLLVQEDTFFRCPGGRLKSGPTTRDPRRPTTVSRRRRSPIACEPCWPAPMGSSGTCASVRTVHTVGRTRVHLDEVEGLGRFVELEVVLADGEPVERGVAEAHGLMAALGIQEDQLVSHAYLDVLRQSGNLETR
jgi:adenylate cyclase class IV